MEELELIKKALETARIRNETIYTPAIKEAITAYVDYLKEQGKTAATACKELSIRQSQYHKFKQPRIKRIERKAQLVQGEKSVSRTYQTI